MKELLSIEENGFTKIDKQENRSLIKLYGCRLLIYKKNCETRKKHSISFKYVESNQSYIDSLFKLIGYLYNYYEISTKHFELLNYAACNLERLYTAQINDLPLEIKTKKLEELSSYLNKVALIFEIATDRMEISSKTETDKKQGERYRQTYATLAQAYSKKADELLGIEQDKTHAAKMLSLCEKALADPSQCPFIEPFQNMATKYREKVAQEIAAQHESISTESEKTPLLGAAAGIPRVKSDGLLSSLSSFFFGAKKESPHRDTRASSAPESELIDDEEKNSDLYRRRR